MLDRNYNYEPMTNQDYLNLDEKTVVWCFGEMGYTWGYQGKGNVWAAFEHNQWWLMWDDPRTDPQEPIRNFAVVQANTALGLDFEEL